MDRIKALPIHLLMSLFFISCANMNCHQVEKQNKKEKTMNENAQVQDQKDFKEGSLPEQIWIYKSDGTRQCQDDPAITFEAMEAELESVKVYSKENKSDGQMRIQRCGALTGKANFFKIDRDQLSKVLKKGYLLYKPD